MIIYIFIIASKIFVLFYNYQKRNNFFIIASKIFVLFYNYLYDKIILKIL